MGDDRCACDRPRLDAAEPGARFVPIPGTPLAFATLDLTSFFQHLPDNAIGAFVYFPRVAGLDLRMWGMISVTDNDTQQVTIVSSQ